MKMKKAVRGRLGLLEVEELFLFFSSLAFWNETRFPAETIIGIYVLAI